jgi:hypothetical protein
MHRHDDSTPAGKTMKRCQLTAVLLLGGTNARDTQSVRWWAVLGAGVSVMLACSMAAPANAPAMSCASVVVVDGSLLWGTQIGHRPGRLPARGPPLTAIEPPCSDGDGDGGYRRVSVTALAGMPVRLAVAPEGDDTSLYVADGSLIELANHPLHGAWYPDASRPSFRRGRSCARTESVTGTVTYPGGFTRLLLVTAGGVRTVRVDAHSRITNRPAYQPVLPKQRLRVRMVKCGPVRVADRIRFVGATIQPERSELGLDDDDDTPAWPFLIAVAAVVLVSIPLIRKV